MGHKAQARSQSVHLRPAQAGDVCVLLETTSLEETHALLQRQKHLQARYGGMLVERVHLTCQRFACDDEALLRSFSGKLEIALGTLTPLVIVPVAFDILHSQIRHTNVLKWRIDVTEELKRFTRIVEDALMETGLRPLYRTGFVSSLVTALTGIPAPPANEVFQCTVRPGRLFTGDVVKLSRIEGPNAFEIIAALGPLGSEPQMRFFQRTGGAS